MTDHSARIAELEAILQEGATTVTVDGTTTVIDLEIVEQQLNQLRRDNTATADRRPRLSSIQTGGLNG